MADVMPVSLAARSVPQQFHVICVNRHSMPIPLAVAYVTTAIIISGMDPTAKYAALQTAPFALL